MSPHGVTGGVIATMSAGPAWPMAAGSPGAPGVARRRVRSGRVILPPAAPMPGHRQSARNRLPAYFCKGAKVSGQGTRCRQVGSSMKNDGPAGPVADAGEAGPPAPLKAPDQVPEAPLQAPDQGPEAPLQAPGQIKGAPWPLALLVA